MSEIAEFIICIRRNAEFLAVLVHILEQFIDRRNNQFNYISYFGRLAVVEFDAVACVSLAAMAGLQVHSVVPVHACGCSAAPLNHLCILIVPTALDA